MKFNLLELRNKEHSIYFGNVSNNRQQNALNITENQNVNYHKRKSSIRARENDK